MRVWARSATMAVPGAGAAIVAAVALALVLAQANGHSATYLVRGNLANNAVLGLGCTVAAVLVLRVDPRHLIGWILLTEGTLNALTVLGFEWATYTLITRPGALPMGGTAAWLGSYAWFPAFLLLAGAVPLLYPDGRLPSPRWRPVGYVVGVATVAAAGAAAMWDGLVADSFPGRANPLAIGVVPPGVLVGVAVGGLLVSFACGVAGVVAMAVRMRWASGDERGRLGWFLAALLLLIVVYLVDPSPWIVLSAVTFLPVALGVAMVRHGLYDGARLLNRTLVYAVLTALIVAVFAAGVGMLGSSLGGAGAGAVAAAVVVALGLDPARALVQHGIDRLLYGQRHDPYTVLTGLGRRLNDTFGPHEVLPVVVGAVAASLRLPYAAVHLGDDELPAASVGTATESALTVALHHAGGQVGRLVIGLPAGRSRLDRADDQLLRDFAAHAAVAVHGVRLTDDLRRSRDRLVLARDEERHRIRRDLHDGLGPTLAGLALGLGAARRLAQDRAPEAAELLGQLRHELQQCLADLRRLVEQMHPTPLAELGLVEALRQYARVLSARSGGALVFTVSAPHGSPAMPAETELGAYRIAMEAMTNVARHADARRCVVRITTDDVGLRLVVRDDGVGLRAASPTTGMGLRSMLERAQELGGRCEITPADDRGTTMTTTLPLRRST